jgi:hypothetical protein
MLGKTDYDFCQFRNKDIQIAINRDRLFKEAVETGKKVEFLEEGVSSKGEIEFKLRNLHPVINPEGDVKMVIGYGLDITKRKRIEIELEKARKQAVENAAATIEILNVSDSTSFDRPCPIIKLTSVFAAVENPIIGINKTT